MHHYPINIILLLYLIRYFPTFDDNVNLFRHEVYSTENTKLPERYDNDLAVRAPYTSSLVQAQILKQKSPNTLEIITYYYVICFRGRAIPQNCLS